MITLILVILWLWALIDCIISTKLTQSQKIFWSIIIIVFNVIGIILYLLFGKKMFMQDQQNL